MNLTYRKATINDLKDVISLLIQDDLGKNRETLDQEINKNYIIAFERIDSDPNQFLLIAQSHQQIVGTCHLTIIPSLTFIGSTRLQIEAVRIHDDYRGNKIGESMIGWAIKWGKEQGAKIIQLSTNKQRNDAIRFYKKLGFQPSHEGMKLYLNQES